MGRVAPRPHVSRRVLDFVGGVDCLARGEKDDVRQSGTETSRIRKREGQRKRGGGEGNYGESVREGCLRPSVSARVAVSLCHVVCQVCVFVGFPARCSRTGSVSCAEKFPEAVVHLVSSRLGSVCLRPPRSHISNHVRV